MKECALVRSSDVIRRLRKALLLIGPLAIALSCIEQATAGQSQSPASPDLEEARNLRKQVEKLIDDQNYDAAMPLARQVLAVREKLLSAIDPEVAEALTDLGLIYYEKGDLMQGEPLLKRALEIREKTLKSDDPLVIESLINLGTLYRTRSDFEKAEPLLQQALAAQERALGPEDREVVASLNRLGLFYKEKGDYNRAETLLERALEIREKVLGSEHPLVAQSLNNLAAVRRDKGDYVRAEPLLERALALREKLPGPQQLDLASSLNNLAGLFQLRGDYDQAELLFRRALSIREKAQPEGALVAESLNNLALLHKQRKDYSNAEPLYQRSLAIREKVLPGEHPVIAVALNNLAGIYVDRGDYERAESLFLRALAIREKALGTDHPDYAQSISNLGSLAFFKGDYSQSEVLHRKALAIFERTLGPEHPLSCLSRNNLAQIYSINGKLSEATSTITLNNTIREKNLSYILSTGSERDKLVYMATLSEETDFTVSFHTQSAPTSAEAARLALTTILRRKGRVMDVMSDSAGALFRRADATDRKLLDRLSNARAKLAMIVLGGAHRSGRAEFETDITRLEAELRGLEAEISTRSAEFRALSRPVTLELVQRAVPFGAALVEIVSYKQLNSKPRTPDELYGPARYIAYVARRKGRLDWVELGLAAPIDSAVEALRAALRNPDRQDVKRLARVVDEKVMRPIRKLLGATRRVVLSADGALNLIPFAVLVDERNHFLVQRYSFSYVTTGRDLLKMRNSMKSKQGPMVVANPDFAGAENSGPETRKLTLSSTGGKAAVDFSRVYFRSLPGTAGEAVSLKHILPGATVLTGAQATEKAVKQVRSPKILHLATHGFFLEELMVGADGGSRGTHVTAPKKSSSRMNVVNPLLRAGLAFAGANERRGGSGEDGILTALEASGLDLWGTKLVVLSACDTGVGEVRTGDGVYGLRRALVLAGAESQLMSLWKVDDLATRVLMVNYYKALRRGRGPRDALRAVQLEMLSRGKYRHPYYWATFIQSGGLEPFM